MLKWDGRLEPGRWKLDAMCRQPFTKFRVLDWTAHDGDLNGVLVTMHHRKDAVGDGLFCLQHHRLWELMLASKSHRSAIGGGTKVTIKIMVIIKTRSIFASGRWGDVCDATPCADGHVAIEVTLKSRRKRKRMRQKGDSFENLLYPMPQRWSTNASISRKAELPRERTACMDSEPDQWMMHTTIRHWK